MAKEKKVKKVGTSAPVGPPPLTDKLRQKIAAEVAVLEEQERRMDATFELTEDDWTKVVDV